MNHSASDCPGSGGSKPKSNEAERKARQRANKHYLEVAEKLNGGTESPPPRVIIKYTRDVMDPVVIEGTLLSKAGPVEVLLGGKKRKILKCAVIVRPGGASSSQNVHQPLAEAVEICRITSDNPPIVFSEATEPTARERTTPAERKAKQRRNSHYVEQARTLNRSKVFHPQSAKWVRQLPSGELKVTNPEFIEGVVLSEPGEVKLYGSKKSLDHAVIVKRNRESNRKDVQQPIAEPVQIGRIRLEPPKEVYSKKFLACQLTGSCSGPDGVRRVLVKYDSTKETWWVPETVITPLTMQNQRRRRKNINYCEDAPRGRSGETDSAEPPADSGGRLAEPTFSPTRNSDRPLTTRQVSILEEVWREAKICFDHPLNHGNWPIRSATIAAMAGLDKKDKSKVHKNTSDLVQWSLIYECLRNGKYMNDIVDVLKKMATSKKRVSSKSKVVRYECQVEGCSTDAHSTSKNRFCFKHWDQTKCAMCKRNAARRKGGLCNTCWGEKQKSVPEEDTLCVNCSQYGYRNKPKKSGGLCTFCIDVNIQLRNVKLCADCGKCKIQRAGGVCESCYNKRGANRGGGK